MYLNRMKIRSSAMCPVVVAGAIVDRIGDHRLAAVVAGPGAVVSAGCALLLPRTRI